MGDNRWVCLLQEPDPPLHEAAKAGDADRVKSLLEEGADPCEADSRGKVPYDVAADKAVRDAFRRSALSLCMSSRHDCMCRMLKSEQGCRHVQQCTPSTETSCALSPCCLHMQRKFHSLVCTAEHANKPIHFSKFG